MRHRIRIGCVAVAAAGLLLAGCGRGGAEGAKVASIGGTTTTVAGGSGSAGNGGGDPQERALAFAKCMREHGIDMPDPKVDANGRMQMRVGGPGVDQAKLEAAQSACQDKMGGAFGPGGGQPDPRFQEAALKYSQCMRQHGVPKFPDPQPNGGLLLRKGSGVDPSSPTFKAADKTCQQLLPRGDAQTTEGGQSSGSGG
ncbi:MAG TPA: hypothetical protein VF486_07645 [Actinomycetes bacterium]